METAIPEKNHKTHLEKVYALCELCEVDMTHTLQVKRLSLSLFDQLNPILQLPPETSRWLEYAAILHDIGWVQGYKAHHKAALEIILSTPILDFENKERLIIGSVVRYHRKALPNRQHDHYAALESENRRIVRGLSALLRLANALDSSHNSVVEDVKVKVKNKKVLIRCTVIREQTQEIQKVERSLKLLQKECGRRIEVRWIMKDDEQQQKD